MDPRCRCTPSLVDGQLEHQHRCPAGGPTYLAIGPWAGLDGDAIETRLGDDEAPPTPARQ